MKRAFLCALLLAGCHLNLSCSSKPAAEPDAGVVIVRSILAPSSKMISFQNADYREVFWVQPGPSGSLLCFPPSLTSNPRCILLTEEEEQFVAKLRLAP